jgi:hypothetical protein
MGWTDWITPIMGAAGAAAGYVGSSSGQSSAEQTTSRIPGYAQAGTEYLWNETMNRLFPSSPAIGGGQKGTILQQWTSAKSSGQDMRDLPDLYAFLMRNNLTGDTDEATFRAVLEADTALTGGQTEGPSPKSYEQQLAEDMATRKAATETFLGKSGDIMKPYTELLDQYVRQGNAGEGLFKPMSIGFGGQPMFSFVPKSNRNLADQLTGYAQRSSGANLGLAEDRLNADTTYTPNKASTDYTTMLLGLVPNLVMNSGSTTTGTANSGRSALYDAIMGGLAGLTAGQKATKP